VRPWRFAKPEPMLRSIHDPKHVAEILSKAWSAVVSKDKEVSVSGTVSGTAAGSASNLVRKTSHNDLSAA
jgi:hypothetical protein